MSNAFYEEGTSLLTPGAFQFVLDNEIKRAVRSQSFLTLIVFAASREWGGMVVTVDDRDVHEVAQIIGKEIRDTDPIGLTERGVLSLVLIEADFEHSTGVIDRLVSRIDSYKFSSELRIAVGAACYPTHAVDAHSLKQQAISNSIANCRGGIRSSGDQN